MNLPNSVTLTMRPVCECGQVIYNLLFDVGIVEIEYGYKYSKTVFDPHRCPSCGKYIECLQIDERYLGRLKKEEL